ncbi:uncharacterized protein LOC128556350 [Mercenaria mercenaria]|uniref:uncharacterized protein LOC128556350 n=1 Tax=Mercenaria mercenaria TaxID=6596 RepID=UPI00234FAB44|nr:uncharacterized protein LOC128556350 [Mercenaria mercenaria]
MMVTDTKLYLVLGILIHFIGVRHAGYCTESYTCYATCYKKTKTTTGCWLIGRCSKYKRQSYSCRRTCYRKVCCSGYTGSDCSIPKCFGSTKCPNGGTCVQPDKCTCPAGFSSPRCADVNECSASSNKCDHKCTNTHGSYRCSCNSGYQLLADGYSCQDINECAKGIAGCDHSCGNTVGSFQCSCRSGYELSSDRKKCKDIDECTKGTPRCQHTCKNSVGSFSCACNKGFQLAINGKSCADIDECVDGSANCEVYCVNTVGSYKCECHQGYELSDNGASCKDIDECFKANGGCNQTCVNEPGTYHCECKDGFQQGTNAKTCFDIDECKEGISGCSQRCQNEPGSFACSCDTGYELQEDLKTCSDINDCEGVTCEHGGACKDGLNSYSCSCMSGYTSAHCETDINECLTHNGGCQEVCMNTEGAYQCGCYDGRELHADGITCPGGGNPDGDVFERYEIGGGLLPKACFVLPLTGCTHGTDTNIQLTSTSEWYSLVKQPSVFFTLGITFVKVNVLSLPISIRGLEVMMSEGQFNLNHGTTYNTEDGSVFVSNETQPDCKSFELVESDIFDFISHGSFFRTLLVSLFPTLPNWISFDKSSDSVLSVQDMKSDLIYGKDMDEKEWCDGAPVKKDHLYTAFTFDSNFSLSVLGRDVKLPVPMKGNKFCVIVDLCHANGGSVFLMIPTASRKFLENVNIFQQLKQKYSLEILPRGIGISVVNGINVHSHKSELKLWNGDTTFKYPVFDRGDVWVGGNMLINENLKSDTAWIVDGNADIYFDVPSVKNLLTSIFVDKWNIFVDIKMKVTLKMKLFGKDFAINLAEAAVESYASIGGKERLWCGESSNPPGIFFSVLLEINPFKGVPLLGDWVLHNRHIAYVFVNYEVQDIFYDTDIKNDILDLDKSVDRIVKLLTTTVNALDIVFKDTIQAILRDVTTILSSLKTLLQNMLKQLVSGTLMDVKRVLEKVWVTFVNMENIIRIFFDETEFILQELFISFKNLLKTELDALKTKLAKSLNEMTNSLIRLASSFTGFGLKYTVNVKLIGLTLGEIDIELVYSSDSLLQCSRFDNVKEHLKGENALRYIGRVTYPRKLNFFLTCDIGGGIGGAFSTSSQHFVMQVQVFARLLGVNATGDLFITRNGLYLYIEGNIWNIFLAQVDISAEYGKDWNALSFRVKGRFVSKVRNRRQTQTVNSSFKDSYLDGLKKAINFIADTANKRLSQAQTLLTNAQNGFSKAQSWLENMQTKVRNADAAFDKAINSLEAVKKKLDEAKKPFEEAMRKLEKAQKDVDNLCKIKTCKTFCIPGMKCRICHKRVWGGRVSYPCCSFTKCIIKLPDPLCVLANVACRIVRAAAYLLLELAKIFVRLPMIAFEAAKVAVSVAQVVVDKSRVVLLVAEGLLEMAQIGLEFAKSVLEAAKLALEGVKFALGAAAKVLELVLEVGIKTIIDVRNCGFDVQISTKDLPVFAVFCDVNAFQLGWTTINIKINFKNIAQSVWNAARATIDMLMKQIGNVIGIGRRRREIHFRSTAKIHSSILRNIRDVEKSNTTETYLNESLDIADSIAGLGEDIDDDYASRVLLFEEKCQKISVVMDFMHEAFDSLHTIVNESKQYINEMNSLKGELQQFTTEGLSENMTLDNMGISKEYAESDYNMTEEDLTKAMEETKASIKDDPLLHEITTAANFSMENLDEEMESIGSINFLDNWLVAMANISKEYFNETECKGFNDCVFYAVSVLYDLYEAEEVPDIDNIRSSILDLENVLIELFQNETQAIPDVSIAIDNVTTNVAFLVNMNPFCSLAPVFLSDLYNKTVLSSSEVVFVCNTTGNPYPQYWWLKNEEYIPNENLQQLTFSRVSTDDTGIYKCISGNVVANITSNGAYLSVVAYDDNECETSNGGCEHLCHNIIGSYECSCHTGYQLNEDTMTCSDINECLDDSSGCAHKCTNTEESFRCDCFIGFVLHENERDCQGESEDKTETAESQLTKNIALAVAGGLLATGIVVISVIFVYAKAASKVKVLPDMKIPPDGPVVEVDQTLRPKKTTFSKRLNPTKVGWTE